MGIPQIWVIDPQDDRTYWRYEGDLLIPRERFSEPAYGLDFDMKEIKQIVGSRDLV
jgi:hypothetical protein